MTFLCCDKALFRRVMHMKYTYVVGRYLHITYIPNIGIETVKNKGNRMLVLLLKSYFFNI